MKKIAVFILFFAFILFRPYQLQNNGMFYSGDDFSYFAHASSIVFGEFPSYDKEYFTGGGSMPLHSPGASIMAVPSVFMFSLIDKATSADIVVKREKANVEQSWSAFGYIIASCIYFFLGCLLLYKGLTYFIDEKYAFYSVVLSCLFQGMPLYVFRRPFFAHSFEFFLVSLLMFMLFLSEKKGIYNSKHFLRTVLIAVVLLIIPAVRGNDIFILLIWPFVLFGLIKSDTSYRTIGLYTSIVAIVFAMIVEVFLNFPLLREALQDNGNYVFSLLRVRPATVYFKRIFQVLAGIDWGLIYTAPFILIGLYSLFRYDNVIKKQLLFCIIPILFNAYIILHLNVVHQGSYYGYRYFFPSTIPVLVYPLALFLRNNDEKHKRILWFFMFMLAVVSFISMISFEGNNSSLTLHRIKGLSGWRNETYQLEVWKMIIFHTKDWFIAVLKGGPLYLVYLAANLFGKSGQLPKIVLQKYSYFSYLTLFKTFAIYSLPFLTYSFFIKFKKKHKK